jgi:O-acetyl-ADP-ribose deacetylase (regulator of RNase III)
LIKDDLTALDVESFVFYARTDLKLGTGYGNAISMRGGPTIQAELDKMDGAQAGDAVISGGGLLKAKYIIHAVGPMFQEENLEDKLKRTMENVLKAADEKGITQLDFTMMFLCFYGVLPDQSLTIMFNAIKSHISNSSGLKKVTICAADNREYKLVSGKFGMLS